MKPLISIIVPIYNVDRYLDKCINSIISQSFTGFELILIDDGSTDSSPEICDRYSRLDSRIIVIHKNYGGVSSARNVGLNHSKGEYIAFVDSDDWIRFDMMETLYLNLINYNADISQCDLIRTHKEKISDIPINSRERVYSNYEILSRMQEGAIIADKVLWNKLYKIELFDHIRFPEGKIHEDEFVNYKLYYKANKIICTNQKMYYYRQRNDSIMGRKFNLSRLDKLDALVERSRFYKNIEKKQLYQKELLHLMKNTLGLYSQVKINNKKNQKAIRYLRKLYIKSLLDLIKSNYFEKDLMGYLLYAAVPDLYNVEKNNE